MDAFERMLTGSFVVVLAQARFEGNGVGKCSLDMRSPVAAPAWTGVVWRQAWALWCRKRLGSKLSTGLGWRERVSEAWEEVRPFAFVQDPRARLAYE